MRQKIAKSYVHELSSFGPPSLERYVFIGRDDNSLDEFKLEEKSNWVRYRKIHQDLKELRNYYPKLILSPPQK